MGKISILWDIPSDAGVYDGGSWLSGNGIALSNLTTQDITEIARTADIAATSTKLRIDMGGLKPVSGFAWINHNAPDLATYGLSYGNHADGSEPLYSAAGLRFWEPTVVWGSRPFGAFPLTLVDRASYPGTPIAFHLAPAQHFARYAFVDAQIPAGSLPSYFQAGRLLLGQAFTPQINYSYGASIKPVDPSEVRRTRGGRRIVRQKPKYRQWRIRFEYQTEQEALGVYFDLQYRLGKSGEMLIVMDPDKPAALRARFTLYCALMDTAEITNTHNGRWAVTFDVEELI